MDPNTATEIAPGIEKPPVPDVEHIVIEDGKPLDNLFSEKQFRLLTEALTSNWAGPGEGRTFVVMSNVGVFSSPERPPVVPDVLLSLDVQIKDLSLKRNRTYFMWEFDKQPDVVIEVVSNKEGREADEKLRIYARLGVPYYAIFDPFRYIQPEPLRIWVLHAGRYHSFASGYMPEVGLGLKLWDGEFESCRDTWLRWCDEKGNLIPTGKERAGEAEQLADQAEQRANRLAAKLKELGVDPNSI